MHVQAITQVNIGFRHVFSAELDDEKRSYLEVAFENTEHIFADVGDFSQKKGWCYRCQKIHRTDLEIDLLICGPSCKDLSSWEQKSTFALLTKSFRGLLHYIF